jgi:hypothetical protein
MMLSGLFKLGLPKLCWCNTYGIIQILFQNEIKVDKKIRIEVPIRLTDCKSTEPSSN